MWLINQSPRHEYSIGSGALPPVSSYLQNTMEVRG